MKLDLPLRLPSRDVRAIASLKGKLLAMIPGKIETFRFDKLAAAQERRAADRRRHGDAAKRSARTTRRGKCGCRSVSTTPATPWPRIAQWIFNNEAYLEGPDGKPIAYDTYEVTEQDKNEVGIAYIFTTDPPLDKLTFVYKTPGTIVARGFDYELKNIELP